MHEYVLSGFTATSVVQDYVLVLVVISSWDSGTIGISANVIRGSARLFRARSEFVRPQAAEQQGV